MLLLQSMQGVTEVTLKTEVEVGASGYSVTGGGDQGIFVKQVLKESSAAKLFSLREGTVPAHPGVPITPQEGPAEEWGPHQASPQALPGWSPTCCAPMFLPVKWGHSSHPVLPTLRSLVAQKLNGAGPHWEEPPFSFMHPFLQTLSSSSLRLGGRGTEARGG